MRNVDLKNPIDTGDKLFDVARWDGILSKKLKRTAKNDGEDRQSTYYGYDEEGKPYIDLEKIEERKARNDSKKNNLRNLVFNGIISNEVCFIEFFDRDEYDDKLNVRLFYCQVPMFLDRVALVYSGRKTGKTWCIKWNSAHRAVNFHGSKLLFWTADDAHTKPRAVEFFKLVDSNKFFRLLLPPRNAFPRSASHPYKQDFINGFEYNAIYPGLSSTQLERFHVDGSIADEAQMLSFDDIKSWSPTQNDPVIERGFIRKFFGVNKFGKTDIPFYQMTFKHDQYSMYEGHVYIIPSWNNPRQYSVTKHIEYLNDFGGSVEAAEFKQMIRGSVGDKSQGVFNHRHYDNCIEMRYKLSREIGLETALPYRSRMIQQQDMEKWKNDYYHFIPGPLEIPEWEEIRVGIDFGSGAGLTVIEIYFLIRGIWHLAECIKLSRVPDDIQAEFVHFLFNREGPGGGIYPDAKYIGIDTSGGGTNIYGHLTAKNNTLFNSTANDYLNRLVPVSFSSPVITGKSLEEPPDGIRKKKVRASDGSVVWNILEDVLPFSTNLIVNRMAESKYSLPEDNDRRTEYVNLYFDGKVYGPKNKDHIISANRCFELTLHFKDTVPNMEDAIYGDLFTGQQQAAPITMFLRW